MDPKDLTPAQYDALFAAVCDVTAPKDGTAVIYDGRVGRALVARGLATAESMHREVIANGGGVKVRRGVEYRLNAAGAEFARQVVNGPSLTIGRA